MGTVNYADLAHQIVDKVGGEANIATGTHCATRLRLTLKDEAKADTATIQKLPGVITVMQAGGQYQIVIGNNVPKVYEELTRFTKLGADDTAPAEAAKGNILNRFIQLISGMIGTPQATPTTR